MSELSLEKIEQRRTVWGNFGIDLYKMEIANQLESQAIIKKLITPTKIEELAPALEKLTEVTREKNLFVDKRKAFTGKLDAVLERLMLPEKSIQEAIQKCKDEIIKIKKLDDAEKLKTKLKEDELAQVAKFVRIYVADKHAEYLRAQNQLLSDSYTIALNGHEKVPGGIPPEKLEQYLESVKKRITIENRTMPLPEFKAVANAQDAVDQEIKKHFQPMSAQEYVDGFAADLSNKYEFYEVAWNDKERALELNKKEAQETSIAISAQQNIDTGVASFKSLAATPTASTAGKELKKLYVLSMPETLESAKVIITAYMANQAICDPKLARVGKWLDGFGVKQMASALEKVKNEDKNFNVTGLLWKEVEKL